MIYHFFRYFFSWAKAKVLAPPFILVPLSAYHWALGSCPARIFSQMYLNSALFLMAWSFQAMDTFFMFPMAFLTVVTSEDCSLYWGGGLTHLSWSNWSSGTGCTSVSPVTDWSSESVWLSSSLDIVRLDQSKYTRR